jgi:LacI family transcriptional regulator
MNPTIKDVAEKANVSVATVSRVINGLPGYSDETKKSVMKAVKDLGYQPNALARGLVSRKSNTLGVLMPALSSMVASEILKGIEDGAHHKGQSVIVCNTDNFGRRTLKYLNVLQEKQVDGIVVVSANLTAEQYQSIMQLNKPVVLVSTVYPNSDLPYIKVDDEKAAYDATLYLIAQGHRNIGMISGSHNDKITGLPRIAGFKKAMKDQGLMVDNKQVFFGNFSFESGQQGLLALLQTIPEITAIFAANDDMAAGVLSQAFKKGIKIPEQLSVIGYDNTQLAGMTTPSLTTLAQPLYEMGRQGMEMLIQHIDKGKIMKNVILPHTIVERETVKKLEEKDLNF